MEHDWPWGPQSIYHKQWMGVSNKQDFPPRKADWGCAECLQGNPSPERAASVQWTERVAPGSFFPVNEQEANSQELCGANKEQPGLSKEFCMAQEVLPWLQTSEKSEQEKSHTSKKRMLGHLNPQLVISSRIDLSLNTIGPGNLPTWVLCLDKPECKN